VGRAKGQHNCLTDCKAAEGAFPIRGRLATPGLQGSGREERGFALRNHLRSLKLMFARRLFIGVSMISNLARYLLRAYTGDRGAPVIETPVLSALILAGLSFFWLLALHHDLSRELAFPTRSDQAFYLRAACDPLNRFALSQKAPLYSAWLGAFCSLSDMNPSRCFVREKLGSLFLLSLLCAYLGKCLFGMRAGVFLGFWIMNSKYIVIESNGSNVLAASLFVASLLCLFLPSRDARLPAATLLLFLSSLARPEMRIPLLAVLLYVAVRGVKSIIVRQDLVEARPLRRSLKNWAVVIIIALALQALITAHEGLDKGLAFSAENAFVLGFGVTYIERHGLSGQFPDPWHEAYEVVDYIMPGVSQPYAALLLYPRLFGEHVIYNVRKSMRVLPSILFGFWNRPLQVTAFFCFLASHALARGRRRHEDRWKSLSSEQAREVIVWLSAVCLLVPVACVFLILWRYYLPLIPAGQIGVLVILQKAWALLPRFGARDPQ
jgi:hypothetical protein